VRRGAWVVAGVAVLSHAAPLRAQTAQERALAEVLFREGVELGARGKHVEACDRFEASQKKDPALGTLLYLADCYDRVGRTASAWISFVEARQQARASGQSEREQIASRRIADLERRLSTIQIEVEHEARLNGLVVEMNGTTVPASSFGVPIPVDPGRSYVRATAPGHFAWTQVLYVEPGPGRRKIEVPALSRPVPRDQPQSEVREPAPGPPRWFGFALGGAGVFGLGAATLLGVRAHELDRDSRGECRSDDENACNAAGKSLRDRAFGAANAATVAAVAGSALLAAGVTWLFFVPASSAKKGSIGLGARVGPGSANIEIGAAL